MLTITLSLFRGSDERTSWRSFGRALLYVLGIVTMFTSIGIFAALTGEFFGGLLQNFWVLLAISAFIIALSLSMFGFYTFRLPSWLVPQHRVSPMNLFSYFLSGLLVGIVAAPCMGPVVLALLIHVSQERNIVFGAGSFLVMALGLGFPYLALGTFSGLLKKLPRSGAWLAWFERLLAVVLFSFGCFYLIIAFRWPIMPWVIPSTLILGGVYLGWLERSSHMSKRFLIFKRIAGTLMTGAGILMMIGMFSPHSQANGMIWEKYRSGILEEAAVSGEPVILDFYADWCIPCHELDQFTYSDPKVVQALQYFRKIKVDATSMDADETLEVIRRFAVFGVPTIIFLDEKGKEIQSLRMNGYIPPGEFVESIHSSELEKYAGDS